VIGSNFGEKLVVRDARRRREFGLGTDPRPDFFGDLVVLLRSLGKEAAKMNLSKPVNPIGNYAFGSVITALILLSPVVAFLMAIAAEMLIDLLYVQGTSAVCAVVAGGIGLGLSRKFWRRPEVVHQSKPEPVPGKTSIAGAPM
jgi:hypothetical protein